MSGIGKTGITQRVGTSGVTENSTPRLSSSSITENSTPRLGTSDITLSVTYRLPEPVVPVYFVGTPDAATFTLTGNDLDATRALVGAAGLATFTLTGNDLGLTRTLIGAAGLATFTITGNNLSATYSGDANGILLENGIDFLLLETGDKLLQED